MTEISELTAKLDTLTLADDLYPNFELNSPKDISEIDKLLIKKLQLIDKYTSLTESINSKLKEGFINISRANYSKSDNLVKYGQDYWDDSVKATKHVIFDKKDQQFKLKNVNIESEEPIKEISSLRNRKNKSGESKSEKPDEKSTKEIKKKQYNPINMFGVLVPYQLKTAQSEFTKSLDDIISLANLVKEIDQLDDKIKSLNKAEENANTE